MSYDVYVQNSRQVTVSITYNVLATLEDQIRVVTPYFDLLLRRYDTRLSLFAQSLDHVQHLRDIIPILVAFRCLVQDILQ